MQWTGHKPAKRTFEMLCHYFKGWASEEELIAHLRKLDEKTLRALITRNGGEVVDLPD